MVTCHNPGQNVIIPDHDSPLRTSLNIKKQFYTLDVLSFWSDVISSIKIISLLHSLVHHNVRKLLAGPPLDACSQERECPHLGDIKGMLLAAASSLVALAGRAQCMCAGKGWVKLEGAAGVGGRSSWCWWRGGAGRAAGAFSLDSSVWQQGLG